MTAQAIGEEVDPVELIHMSSTKRLLREFIDTHVQVRDLQQRMKVAKDRRQAVEKDLAQVFIAADVHTVDIPGYRLYRLWVIELDAEK
ncbi:hypothetical protein HDU90_004297 [Geranomyces variabilis]|nr:hypothetical protein HDU90_004297 [Geranomyces variabilis]